MTDKKADTQKKLSRQLLKTILDNLYDEVVAVDANDRIIYANKASEKHYSVRKSSLVGKYVHEVPAWANWEPNTLPTVKRAKKRVTLEQTSPLGEKILTTATPVLNQNNDIEMIVYNVRDVAQLESVKQGLELTRELLEEIESQKGEKTFALPNCDMVAADKEMQKLTALAESVAVVDATILLQGESGTGKGLLAKFIHNKSLRKEAPFLVINCAAIPENLLESELFGYAPGTFTGGHKDGKKGLIELAQGGTLFLDEIAELSPNLQAKFLHVIQEKQFMPLGGREVKTADVRIIAATNRHLIEMIKEGSFREDLYYRLNVISLLIPPLRERPEDIPTLAYTFLRKFDKKYNTSHDLSTEFMDCLLLHPWNGNIRELENLMERLTVTIKEPIIDVTHLPAHFSEPQEISCRELFPLNTSLDDLKEEIEKDLVQRAYERYRSSRKVGKSLKISQTKASRLIRKHVDRVDSDS
ncbi:MAG: sigma 54-interacting transcriptional regulator [Proteobacteria bacterium]|nr:sigma 54-interacting transcriptional regulator [Pseudomonadota bacterium]MBU1585537.1 sigma 54-interacting transcriptional regulator [Pseudomonadota bacterium]MBU2630043.1 sigma 54-interacting transcriptional regulator [Pseudomonadota bacterium]